MTDKVIIYRRFSTDDQESGDSFARQQRVCESYARSKLWEVVEQVDDRGRSAYKNEHIDFGNLGLLTRRIESGELDQDTIILVEKLDRLSRRPFMEVMSWINKLTNLGVRIAVADLGIIYNKTPDIATHIIGTVVADQSNLESAKKADRILSAKRAQWGQAEERKGGWINLASRPPLWLKRNLTLDGWTIDEERKAVVNDIFQWSADGLGSQGITRRLNEANISPWDVWRKHELKWGLSAVNQLLRNPAVEGDYVGRTGAHKGRVIRGFYPRIVDADLVARSRQAMSERQKAKDKPARSGVTGLFSGLITCATCGHPAYLTTHQKGRTYRYVRCEGARESRGCDNSGYYSYSAFEDAALDLCVDLALDDRYFESSGDLKKLRIAKAEAERAINDKTQARARLIKIIEDGDDQVIDRVHQLKREISGLTEKVADLDKSIQVASGKVGDLEHLRRVSDIRDAAKSPDPNEREQARAKLQRAISAITNSVMVGTIATGEKVFTMVLMGGILAVRFDTRGKIVDYVSDVLGKRLYEHLPQYQQDMLKPLIDRVEKHAWKHLRSVVA